MYSTYSLLRIQNLFMMAFTMEINYLWYLCFSAANICQSAANIRQSAANIRQSAANIHGEQASSCTPPSPLHPCQRGRGVTVC